MRRETFNIQPIKTTPSIPDYQSRILGNTVGRVRRLKGFQKSHHLPDGYHDAAQSFVRKIGQDDVKAIADQLYGDIRSLFGYKRRQFAYSCEDGFALIKTPDFDLEIRIDQDTQEAKNYILTTEITALHTDSIAQDPRFHTCFNFHCDQLVIDWPSAIDLNEKIDRIEDIPEIADCLNYAPDGSQFELKLIDLDLHLRVTESQMCFQLLTLRNLGKLLEQSQQAFEILTAAGLYPKLGG